MREEDNTFGGVPDGQRPNWVKRKGIPIDKRGKKFGAKEGFRKAFRGRGRRTLKRDHQGKGIGNVFGGTLQKTLKNGG